MLEKNEKYINRCDRWETKQQFWLHDYDYVLPVCVSECLAYSCFTQLMKRMSQNFPNGGAMDTHFANMRSLIQVMDNSYTVCVCVRERVIEGMCHFC